MWSNIWKIAQLTGIRALEIELILLDCIYGCFENQLLFIKCSAFLRWKHGIFSVKEYWEDCPLAICHHKYLSWWAGGHYHQDKVCLVMAGVGTSRSTSCPRLADKLRSFFSYVVHTAVMAGLAGPCFSWSLQQSRGRVGLAFHNGKW